MLRYLEDAGLVVPRRGASGYRVYGLRELNQLRSLRELRAASASSSRTSRSRRGCGASRGCATPSHTWLAGSESALEWEQRKHERLLAA